MEVVMDEWNDSAVMRNLVAKQYELVPAAWEVWVRSDTQDWVKYSLYETEKQAIDCCKRAEGPPLELEVRPLYRKELK